MSARVRGWRVDEAPKGGLRDNKGCLVRRRLSGGECTDRACMRGSARAAGQATYAQFPAPLRKRCGVAGPLLTSGKSTSTYKAGSSPLEASWKKVVSLPAPSDSTCREEG